MVNVVAPSFGEAEECTSPSRDGVVFRDAFSDQEWQGIVVAEDEFSCQCRRSLLEAERHEQAGFGPDEIEITQTENTLLIAGQKQPEAENGQFLHRGIATRAFKQTFNLADYVKVKNARRQE